MGLTLISVKHGLKPGTLIKQLNPYHFGAASGMGMNYIGLDDFEGAIEAFRQTLKILPHSKSTARYVEILE